MRAAVFGAPYDIHLEERETPTPAEGEALIRVKAAGVCGGDVYIYKGTSAYASYPRVAGHETAGVVAALGPNTAGPAIGTRVAIEPFIGCGKCYACRIGKSNCCANLRTIGVHRDGGFADFVTTPVDRLHHLPDSLSDFHASFTEPVAIGVQCSRRGMITSDDTILILGAGPIGLALLEVTRAKGTKVYITDVNQERLAAAVGLGGLPLEAGETLPDQVMSLTGGEGMPVVVEVTGNPKVMESTVDLVAAGGRIVIVGLVPSGIRVAFPGLDFTRKEMTIVGSRASVDCFPESIDLLARGAIRYPEVASTFDLAQAREVFERMSGHGAPLHKAVFMGEHG